MSGVSSRALPAALLLTALGLCAVVWLEVSGGIPDSRSVIARSTSAAGFGAVASSSRPAALGREQVAAWADTAQARPLFNVRRRPAILAAPSAAPVAGAALPRMTGTLVTPSMRRAFFAGADGRAVVVAEGGQLGGFTVTAIQAGRITVSGPGGERTIVASFDPDPPSSAQLGRTPPGAGLPGLPGLRGLNLGGVPGLTPPVAAR